MRPKTWHDEPICRAEAESQTHRPDLQLPSREWGRGRAGVIFLSSKDWYNTINQIYFNKKKLRCNKKGAK